MIIWVGLGEFLERQIGGKMAALAGPGWPALTLLHAACLPSLSLSSPAHQCNTFGPTFGAHGKLGVTLGGTLSPPACLYPGLHTGALHLVHVA